MNKVWKSLGRLMVLLLAAVWLHTVAHTATCHSDNALCGHDGCSESTVCTCFCHAAIEPTSEQSFSLEQPITVWVPSFDETTLALLLPDDIFRPPLTNS